jgi:hypothetical protein
VRRCLRLPLRGRHRDGTVIADVLDRHGRQRPAQRRVQDPPSPSISLNVQIRAQNLANIAGASDPSPVMERTIPSSLSPIKASPAPPGNPRTSTPLHFSPIRLYLSNSSVNYHRSRRRNHRLEPCRSPGLGRGDAPWRVDHPGGAVHLGELGGGRISAFPFSRVHRKMLSCHHLRHQSSSSSVLQALR